MLNDESTDEHDDDRLASSKINKTSRYLKQNNVKISSTSNKSRNNNAPVLRRSIAANIKNQKFNELSRSSSCSSNVIGSSTRGLCDIIQFCSRVKGSFFAGQLVITRERILMPQNLAKKTIKMP